MMSSSALKSKTNKISNYTIVDTEEINFRTNYSSFLVGMTSSDRYDCISDSTAFYAMTYVDLFLQRWNREEADDDGNTDLDLHLLGVTCLFVASKVHGVYDVLEIEDLPVFSGRRSPFCTDVENMEKRILSCIDFQLFPPSPHVPSNLLLQLISDNGYDMLLPSTINSMHKLLRCAMTSVHIIRHSSFALGVGSVFVALESLEVEGIQRHHQKQALKMLKQHFVDNAYYKHKKEISVAATIFRTQQQNANRLQRSRKRRRTRTKKTNSSTATKAPRSEETNLSRQTKQEELKSNVIAVLTTLEGNASVTRIFTHLQQGIKSLFSQVDIHTLLKRHQTDFVQTEDRSGWNLCC